jgi:hypothetical protein
LRWQDNSLNETGFVLERSVDGISFAPLAALGPRITAYLDALAPAGTNYYRVAATNSLGSSEYSNVAWAGAGRTGAPTGMRVIGWTR